MAVPYSPLAVANHFISEHGGAVGVEHMKLQKLVYFAHGWWIAAYYKERPNLVDERPQVWKHGPVFESLYKVLKVFGSEPIREAQSATPFDEPDAISGDDEEARRLIGWIWARYGHLSSFALSDLTHRPGTAWRRVAEEYKFSVPFNLAIPDEYIYDEFREMMDGEAEGAKQDGARRATSGGTQATA